MTKDAKSKPTSLEHDLNRVKVESKPLESAQFYLNEVKEAVRSCSAVDTAFYSAIAGRFIESAYYEREIGADKMFEMRNALSNTILDFYSKCDCVKKATR